VAYFDPQEAARHAGSDVDVRVLELSHERSQARRVVAERRRERIVNDVKIPSVWRERRRSVVTAIAGSLDLCLRRPHLATVRGVAEPDRFSVKGRPAIGPDIHNLVGSAAAGRSAVGDIDARRSRKVITRTRDSILDAPSDHRVNEVTWIDNLLDGDRLCPALASVS